MRSGEVAAVTSIGEAATPTAMWITYFWVDSADEAASMVREAGGQTVIEPFDFMDAGRTAAFTDPEGAGFRVWEAGAPAGFEDVVASINPIADDQPDTPPHWSVTFAVDDTDATAANAAGLGGKVIVPPFDAPWSTPTYTIRITIVADPQGATFAASKFVPET